MALAARICRKIRGYRSDGSGGPEQVYGVGVRPHSKAAGIHMVFGQAKGGPNGVREGHGYPHDVSLHVWEQNLCIFTLFSLSGEQHLCIFTLFSLSGE